MSSKQLSKFELTTFWTDDADFYIYAETTADGYEIYVATHDPSNVTITEDVYYYDGDLEDVMYKAIINGGKIYVDDLDSDWAVNALDKFNKENSKIVNLERLNKWKNNILK